MARGTLAPVVAAAVLAAAALAASGPSLTVYFTPGFDDAAWQQAAYDKVAKAWKPAGSRSRGPSAS